MKRILVTKDVAYANNKAGDGANSALNPIDLGSGAIGIYGIPASGANADKFSLITDGVNGSGQVADTSFDGDKIVVALGTPNGAKEATPIDLGPLQDIEVKAAAYTAPTAGKTTIGYSGVGTGLNLPTAEAGDEVVVSIKEQDEDNPIVFAQTYTAVYGGGESDYSVISKLVGSMLDDEKVNTKLVHNGSGTPITNAATASVTHGSKTVTTSAAHGVGVGDFVSLGGDLYQAVTGTSGSTIVLDRPYGGASGTIANADAIDLGASAPSELGIECTDKEVNKHIIVSGGGNLEYADHKVVASTQGSGTPELVKELEDKWAGWLGTSSKLDASIPQPPALVDSTKSYALYYLIYKNADHPDGNNRVTNVKNSLVVVFEGNSNGAQAEFEDIMGTLINGADGLGGLA